MGIERMIHMYHKDGKYIKSYDKIIDVYDDVGIRGNTLSMGLKDKFYHPTGGYYFSFYKFDNLFDSDIIKENVFLAKQRQKFQDTNRIERKGFREHARIENAIIDYEKELIKLFEKRSLSLITHSHKNSNNKTVMVVHLSDLHLNELVDIPGNKYDFFIAAKRLKRFADKIKEIIDFYDINEIVLAITGDVLNSDRKLDELLSMATNRAKATFIAVDLLQQFINDLNKFGNITVIGVSGNESRVKEYMGWTDLSITDNYDYTIHNILKILFKDKKGIKFGNTVGAETVINIAGQNLLLTHGYKFSAKSSIQDEIQQIKGRYTEKGIKIDYVIFGHIHSCAISDTYARCGSMVGSNAYSENELNYAGRASQNIYLFHKDKSIDGIKIDLQYCDDYRGYNIDDDVNAYHPKSVEKCKKVETIMKIVI